MEKVYDQILEYIITSGLRLLKKKGNISDIGVRKINLTEEDLRIERELAEIIIKENPNHKIFAEELHSQYLSAENLWVIDPISGTSLFINGEPHFAIVISHIQNQETQFAAVYDPTTEELFTAYKSKGAFLNGAPIQVSNNQNTADLKLLFAHSDGYDGKPDSPSVFEKMSAYRPIRLRASFALQYCYVACGKYDGVFAMTHDIFPEVAGGLIIREAGGVFKNDKRSDKFSDTDRVFIGGNQQGYRVIDSLVLT